MAHSASRKWLTLPTAALLAFAGVIAPGVSSTKANEAEFSFVYGTPAVIRGDTWWLSNDFNANVYTSFAYGIAGDQFVAQRAHCRDGIIGPDQVQAGGARWDTWKVMANLKSRSWYAYGGAWGEVGVSTWTTGPLGPYPGRNGPPDGFR